VECFEKFTDGYADPNMQRFIQVTFECVLS